MEKPDLKATAWDILATGFFAGVLYFAVNVILFFPSERLGLVQSAFLRFNLFAYSLAIWLVSFTVLSAILHLVTYPLAARSDRRGLLAAKWSVVWFVIALVFLAGYTAWTTYGDSAPHVPNDMKLGEVKAALLKVGLVATILSLVAGYVTAKVARRCPRAGARRPRSLAAVVLIGLAYVVLVNLPFDFAGHGGGSRAEARSGKTQIVVLGIDAGSWNVLLPFVKNGDLPAFSKMLSEGTYGFLNTYGAQYTPPSWTSIATGKAEENHGVHDFTNVSSDWLASPVWSIMSSAGKTAGVVNWVCTWPPFKVNGGFISEAQQSRPGGVLFSAAYGGYQAVAESIVTRWEYAYPETPDEMVAMAGRELEQLSAIDRDVMSRINPDLVAYYYYYPDLLQHFFWKDMDPKSFSTGDWAGEPIDPRYGDAIRQSYIGADRFLQQLMDTYGPAAHYFVVSDHGARPIKVRQANLNMERLLEELGWLSRSSGEVDRAASTCYPAEGGSPEFAFNLKINPAGYAEGGVVDPERYAKLSAEITASLKAVRLDDSRESIFRDVLTRNDPAPEARPDLVALVSRAIMEMPDERSVIVDGGRSIPTGELFHYHPWSGRHRARGILLASGPAIRHRYSGAWTIDDAYTLVRRYTHGIFRLVDKFSPLFRRLHLMNEALTVDIAPTLLYLEGLPVAEDMDGRVLAEIVTRDFRNRNPVRSVATYPVGASLDLKGDAAEDERIKQRLKAIGYLQ